MQLRLLRAPDEQNFQLRPAEFRKRLPLYESDRPLSPDIKKAYEFIKEGVLLKEVRDKL